MTKYLNRIWAVVLLAFVSCALWGSAFPMIKIGYTQFGITESGPGAKILFAGVRFILAGILAWLAGSAVKRSPMLPHRGDWKRDRKSTRLNSSHWNKSRMPSSA